MRNQALFEYAGRVIEGYRVRVEHETRVIKLIEAGKMHSSTNGVDTTAENLERAKQSLEALYQGIDVMEQARAELVGGG